MIRRLFFFTYLTLSFTLNALFAMEEGEEPLFEDPFCQESFILIKSEIERYLIRTPLVPLPTLSHLIGKPVYLKDESRQKGLSFKSRGVTHEVFSTIETIIKKKPYLLKEGLELVTQTDGNHGIALLIAITSAIEKYSTLYPDLREELYKIEPMIFTYKNVLSAKREGMERALEQYRRLVGASERGKIIDTFRDYGEAKTARESYIEKSCGKALYMEHGGIKTMQGHGVASLEIIEQLELESYHSNRKICLLLPIGAGGPIGLAAALKTFRPNSKTLMIQTPRYDAFIRSYHSGEMEHNDSTLSPYTVEVPEGGKMKPVIYEDGISVDAPESMQAITLSQKYIDDAIYADPKRALELSPLLLVDLDKFYEQQDQSRGVVGGTTAILVEALISHMSSPLIREADIIVLFGTEGSIDPAIERFTRQLTKGN